MILENERINCAWPGQSSLKTFFCSRISLTRMSTTVWVNMFPINNFVFIQRQDMSDSEAVKSILTDLNFDFVLMTA
jgi:hypothetical protein